MSRSLTTKIDECSREACPHRKLGEWRGERYVRQHCGLADREFEPYVPPGYYFKIPDWCPLPEWSEE